MVKNKKRIKKSIESYEKLIKEHIGKKEKFGEDKPWLKEYWEKQIQEFEKQKEKEKKRLDE